LKSPVSGVSFFDGRVFSTWTVLLIRIQNTNLKNQQNSNFIQSLLLITATGFSFTGCTTNTIDDVVMPVEETANLVTYQDVQFIFENTCTRCHANPPQNGAPMSLVNFAEARDAIRNRGLLDRVSREEGASGLMPLGGPRMPQATIDLLFEWNEDGLLEN